MMAWFAWIWECLYNDNLKLSSRHCATKKQSTKSAEKEINEAYVQRLKEKRKGGACDNLGHQILSNSQIPGVFGSDETALLSIIIIKISHLFVLLI